MTPVLTETHIVPCCAVQTDEDMRLAIEHARRKIGTRRITFDVARTAERQVYVFHVREEALPHLLWADEVLNNAKTGGEA